VQERGELWTKKRSNYKAKMNIVFIVLSLCRGHAIEESFEKEVYMMIQIKRAFTTVLNKQYPCPHGVMGRIAGELMVHQHGKETAWTVEIADVQPADSVLEIGFGAGKAIELLAEKTPRGSVTGIDLSVTMVQRARARNGRAVRAGLVTLQQGDAAHLPFAEQQPGGTCFITFSTVKAEETGLGDFQPIIEEQMLPEMRTIGWTSVSIKQGPIVRQYKTVAVIGIK
jgi:hypothetical protein